MPADLPATPEMLDPDPQQPSGQPPGPRWERLIGLMLVIVLTGYGLVTWWSDSAHQSAYRTGLRAALDNDWDAALIAFGRADDYADAKVRANNAAIHVRERDTVYPIAAAAFAHRDWAALIPAVERLAKVAPTYRDTPHFVQTLETEVYTPALSDTVALRLQAQPPGWYVYRPGGWRYLDGSDVQSRIRARCPDGSWVLDMPGPPRAGTPAACRALSPPGTWRWWPGTVRPAPGLMLCRWAAIASMCALVAAFGICGRPGVCHESATTFIRCSRTPPPIKLSANRAFTFLCSPMPIGICWMWRPVAICWS